MFFTKPDPMHIFLTSRVWSFISAFKKRDGDADLQRAGGVACVRISAARYDLHALRESYTLRDLLEFQPPTKSPCANWFASMGVSRIIVHSFTMTTHL